MPCRLGASGSVRARSRHQSACMAPLAHSFWPLTRYVPPTFSAHGGLPPPVPPRPVPLHAAGGGAEAGEVGPGVGLGEALDPDLAVEDGREVAAALFTGP